MMVNEIQDHLMQTIIPFWKNLRDNEYGGYYGYMTYDLAVSCGSSPMPIPCLRMSPF